MPRPGDNRDASLTRREHLLVAGLFAIVALVMFQELTRHPTHLLVGAHRGGENDLTTYFLRALEWPRIAWQRDRQFPGWNPHLSLGAPTVGNPQSLLSYPPNWLCWCIGATSSVSWLLVVHHWWAGLGSYLLATQFGVRRASAMIAGLVGMAAPYAIAHTSEGHYAQTCMMAWLPWTLWAFERFLKGHGERWLPVAVCLAMSFFGGHVQETYYLALLMSGVVVMATATAFWSRSSSPDADSSLEGNRACNPLQLTFRWCLVAVATLGLVAIDLIPTWINSRLTIRAGGLPMSIAGDGLKPQQFVQLWNPSGFDREAVGSANGSWETLLYFGVIPLALAMMTVRPSGGRPGTRRLKVLLFVTILFAFGSLSPVFRACYAWIPGISSFRSPARVLYISSIFVSALAAIGWDSLWSSSWDQKTSQRRLRLVATLVALGGIGWELGRFATRVLATVPSVTRQDSEVSRFLRSHVRHERVMASIGVYSDAEAIRDGLQKPQGYEPFPMSRAALAIAALTPTGTKADLAGFQGFSLRGLHKPIADLLGIRFAVMHSSQGERAGWKRVASGEVPPEVNPQGSTGPALSFAIFENVTALPRAFVIGKVKALGEGRSQNALTGLRELNPRDSVLLTRDRWGDVARAKFASASIERYTPNEVHVHAVADGHGYLVLTDSFHPGWSATVDGQSTEILPANVSFRAVPLTPGEHRIVFQFTPPGWPLGAIVSAVSWLGAGSLAFRRCRGAHDGVLGQRKEFDITDVRSHAPPLVTGLSGEPTKLA